MVDYRNFNEDFSLEGKTAIVTGAASGIGYEIAKMYARKGANVVSFDMNKADDLDDYMKEQGVGYLAYVGNITKTADIDDCVAKTVETFGRLDILVNCAGIGVVQSVLDHEEDLWDKTLSINLTGTVRFGRAAAKVMKEQGDIILYADEVLHIPGLGFDGLVGYSPIALAKNAIGISIACEEYGASFFGNNANPSGVLEHPGVIKNPDKLRDAWHRAYGGKNSHKVAVLEEGVKFTPISIPNNEAQFLETRKFQIEEIARMYRVPLHMIGDLDHATFSNVEHLSLDFVKYSLDPWIVRWEQSLQKALLSDSEKGQYFVKFNVDGLLRGDYASRMQGYATARQNGWMSANDIREKEDMNMLSEDEGGNLYLVNGSFTKLADAGAFANQHSEKEEKTK